MSKVYDFLLLGYYGFGNLGDELLAEAVLSLLLECGIKKESVAVLSASPRESEARLGIRAFNRWDLREVSRACRSSRALLLGGGGLFQESTSLRSCLYYYAVVRIAALHGAKIMAAGQSVGPLRSFAARALTKNAFSLCADVAVRDKPSFAWLSKWKIPARLSPDLVMSLRPQKAASQQRLLVNIRPGHDELAALTLKWAAELAKARGISVTGIALSDDDAALFDKFKKFDYADLSDIITVRSLDDFSQAAQNAGGAVGMRLHFLILSCLCGVPSAGSAYDPKVGAFCAEYGLSLVCEQETPSLCVQVSEARLDAVRGTIKKDFISGVKAVLPRWSGESNG
ncbi:MAG: polysaccharide pyruvyl transferase CsaB [Cloacibacillus sp.]